MDTFEPVPRQTFPTAPASHRASFWVALVGFCGIGWLLRAYLASRWPTIERPDEIFQTLEPAHRLWTGWGIVTWEWREGIRSWLFPDLLYGLMRLTDLMHLPEKAVLPFIWAAMSLISAAVIGVGVALGWKRFGLVGALCCGLLTAIWPDLVYFGPKTLTEVQSGNLLAVAAALGSVAAWRRSPGIVIAVGTLLGLAFDLRFQLAPALVLVALWVARADLRRGWLPLVLGALVPVLALGAVDWVTWGSPFQSIWKNVEINFFHNKAEFYGVAPFSWYLTTIAQRDGASLLPLAILFVVGARQAPLLALNSLVVVGFHSLIAHKELSFVYAALPTAIIVVGLGTAAVVEDIPSLLKPRVPRPWALGAAVASWLAVSVLTGYAGRPYRQPEYPSSMLTMWGDLRATKDLCGLAYYDSKGDFPWIWSMGYAGLNRPVPFYLPRSLEAMKLAEPGANYVVATADDSHDLPGYQRVHCSWSYCLLHRPGPCNFVPSQEISNVLHDLGA